MDEDSAKEEELLDRIDAKVEDINAEITLWNEAVIEYAASRSDRTERFNKALYNTVFMNPAPLGIFTEAAVKWYARELVEK